MGRRKKTDDLQHGELDHPPTDFENTGFEPGMEEDNPRHRIEDMPADMGIDNNPEEGDEDGPDVGL